MQLSSVCLFIFSLTKWCAMHDGLQMLDHCMLRRLIPAALADERLDMGPPLLVKMVVGQLMPLLPVINDPSAHPKMTIQVRFT